MKAFVIKEPGIVGWADVQEPKLTPYGAILKPVAMAPCSSDVHTVFGGGSRKTPNLVLGHECVAQILETGEYVEDFKPGESWQSQLSHQTGEPGESKSIILNMHQRHFLGISWDAASQEYLQKNF